MGKDKKKLAQGAREGEFVLAERKRSDIRSMVKK